jgi:hypothetical protein
MKSYTDIEQSKKLAEILPLESADMWYHGHYSPWKSEREYDDEPCPFHSMRPNWDKQCWSLTALLDVLPNEIITDNRFECHYQIHIRKYNGGDNTTLYQIAYGNDRGSSGSWHDMINTGEKDNLVDACYQMIIRLKELKML